MSRTAQKSPSYWPEARKAALTVAVVVSAMLPANIASADSLALGGIRAAAGVSSSAQHQLGATGGLSLAGVSSGNPFQLSAGFWFWADSGVSSSEEDAAFLPHITWMDQNAPNPFRSQTTLRFQIAPSAEPQARVRLEVFDVAGRSIHTLVDDSLSPGHYRVEWNQKDGHDRSVAAGVYFARLQVGREFVKTIRLVAAN